MEMLTKEIADEVGRLKSLQMKRPRCLNQKSPDYSFSISISLN